jgi:hypothetical protein
LLVDHCGLSGAAYVHHIGDCRSGLACAEGEPEVAGFGMANEYEDRKRLTFEQAQGLEPLPSQLGLKEMSVELCALLWEVIYSSITASWIMIDHRNPGQLTAPWDRIFYDKHVYRNHRPADEFFNDPDSLVKGLKVIFFRDDYSQVLGSVQWLLRHRDCPHMLARDVELALRQGRGAYSVFDRDTIIPIGSDAERETLARVFADVAASEFHGARAHLRNAGSELTADNYAASVRESIQAVESVARVLEPTANALGPALSKLEKSAYVHGALGAGFRSLYGFASDEEGIRHPLLDKSSAQVDETDALYMLGSCAAFVSYLINKARQAGLLSGTA